MVIFTIALRRRMKPDAVVVFLLKIIRLMGGLPYTWLRGQSKAQVASWCSPASPGGGLVAGSPPAEVLAFPHSLERRPRLVACSRVFIFLFMAIYTILFLARTINTIKDPLGDLSSTESFAVQMIFITLMIISIGKIVYLGVKSRDLARVVDNLHTVLAHTRRYFWKPDQDLFFFMLLISELSYACQVVMMASNAYGLHQSTSASSLITHIKLWQRLAYLVMYFFMDIVVTAAVMLFYSLSAIVPSAYCEVLPDRRSQTPPDQEGGSLPDKVPGNGIARRIQVMEADYIPSQGTFPSDERQAPTPLSIEDVTSAAERLNNLHHFQGLFNNYFTIPVTLGLLSSVVAITGHVFLVSVLAASKGSMESLSVIIRLLKYVSILVLLFCAPDEIHKKRQELRNRILVQQMKVPEEAVALKLGRLLQLMDAFPDFNMGGLFILGKSKLIGIASFVATYLVILLQFNLSDPTEEAVPQETTNTTVHPTC
ncbi:uncharacterized protein [Panulirus ornatus]|uniref:uncharacterized protein isoform X2 n=1 Tax=Panulirus ornatus TaxID=150431 RepID=UPI003A85A0A5